jgi:hypothetical protein
MHVNTSALQSVFEVQEEHLRPGSTNTSPAQHKIKFKIPAKT